MGNKIISWIKDNYILVAILIFATILRLYLYSKIGQQTHWWDGAEFMNMARAWAFHIPYQFHPVRPILLSLINALFFKMIPGSELLPRAFIFGIGILSIYAVYLLGNEAYNKKVGLIAAFLMSLNYFNIFYTFRILADLPTLTFFTLSAYFFLKYFKYHKPRDIYWAAVMTGIGTLFKLPVASILFVVAIFIVLTEGLTFLKKKEIYIAALIFLLILSPYLIWGYMQFGGFVISQAGAYNMAEETGFAYVMSSIQNVIGYLRLFPTYFPLAIVIAFVAGLITMKRVIYGWDVIFSKEESETRKKLKRDLFLILLFIIPFVTIVLSLGYVDSRILLIVFPIVSIIGSAFIIKMYDLLAKEKNGKILGIIIIALILTFPIYGLKQTEEQLVLKSHSYEQVKWAGVWLKENTLPTEAVVSTSTTQIRYYSERETFDLKQTEEEFDQLLIENPQIKYYLLASAFEPARNKDWMFEYPGKHNLELVKLYSSGEQAILGIYKLK